MKFSPTLIRFVTVATAAFAMRLQREFNYGDPDLIIDQGNCWRLNFDNIPKNGERHDDVFLGDPDSLVDEGNRWRINYDSPDGHENACDGHYMYLVSPADNKPTN
ncbi:hypothetical protein CPB83DRAFT_832651 [Crepidotus variabilis]|uniref:Uncharacterized protein n=1 Tax=Crepidotus variabilis TaxID=179855 RepID=A0A9P6JUJ6_9AGAR|nr:hypothetical protein CPB83DRAFT_832651 [Crepidotus variabilis]